MKGATLSGGAPVLTAEVGKTVLVKELTITHGSASCSGVGCFAIGGIANFGTLTLSNSKVNGNSASCSGGGCSAVVGGIGNSDGTMTLSNSTVSGNSASCNGCTDVVGGIDTFVGTPTLTKSKVKNNTPSSIRLAPCRPARRAGGAHAGPALPVPGGGSGNAG